MAASSARRRVIWDSVSVTATTAGLQSLFTDASGKAEIQMDPLINGDLPSGQRMTVEALSVALPPSFDAGDDARALDSATISFIVNDNEAESVKLDGLVRNFPAGGGMDGLITMSGDTVATLQAINNGLPTPMAMYWFNDLPIVIERDVSFEVVIDIPTALTGLTTGRWYVYLHGLYEYLIPGTL